MTGSQMSQLGRHGLSYAGIAQVYDLARPGYPDDLFAHLADRLKGPQVLEVGAGTGKATVGLVARGFEVTCVEPVADMAAVLAERTAEAPPARIEAATFEAATAGGPFDGLVSAQAWHWTDPATRMDRAASLLRPGGYLGLFWNSGAIRRQDAFAALQTHYDEFGLFGDDRPQEPIGTAENVAAVQDPSTWPGSELADHPAFEYLGTRLFQWSQDFTAEQFAAFLLSTSHYQLMDPGTRDRLLTAVTATLRARFDNLVTMDWSTQCYDALLLD